MQRIERGIGFLERVALVALAFVRKFLGLVHAASLGERLR